MESIMRTVQAIHVAPVKSLGLVHPHTVHVDFRGIIEDRRLYLIDEDSRLLTQRELGRLVQIEAQYCMDPEWLCLRFPNGNTLEGPVEPGEPVMTRIWGRYVLGHVVVGDWNGVLSEFCRHPVRLVRSDEPGQCYDEYPVSLISQASVEELSRQPGATVAFDSRRFRPNFFLAGCQPHEEDTWLGGIIQIGNELCLWVMARDPRCVITTHDPDTGERDIDTLRLIINYRPSPKAAYFGVYGIVVRPGAVSVGDTVTPLRVPYRPR
jgi:uncharacterized protein YcbX